ncbi:GNAT family protein [Dyella sp. A6]|uniref:GNAT family N-acetyltransferase n=1 Tax=Dyella aluminiiresistens TaxID=3069105 RepID=UPI002E7A8609|nr:GNAT family protein [Dyella sp. A6]
MQLVTPPETVELGDEKVRLRPWRKEDMPALLDAVQSSLDSLGRWLPWCHPEYGQPDAESYLAQRHDEWTCGMQFSFAVLDATTGSLIGAAGLSLINTKHRSANLGYWIRRSRQGEGLAARAARHVAYFGFDRLQLIRIEIVAMPDNHASRRTAERIGARFEVIARQRVWSWDKPHDAAVYGLIPSDLASVG